MKRSLLACLLPLAPIAIAAAPALGQTRTYAYDAAGNRTSATNQIRFTSVAAFTVQPERATGGGRVNIYGRNFPYAEAGQMAVTFGGVAGTILSVAPRVVTCEVPLAAVTGDVVLTLPGGQDLTVATLVIAGIALTPNVAEVTPNQQVQFSATVQGAGNMTVDWEVNGVPGGDSSVGTIDSTGLYTAPDGANDEPFPYLIKASNQRIQQAAYALVKPGCTNGSPIGDEQFELGSASVASQRDCWEFNAAAWDTVYVAAIADSGSLFRLNLRDSSGALLASAGAGQRLRLANIVLTQDDLYRIEVEAGASPAGSYRVWVDVFDVYPDGRWMFPGDEFWDDPENWSNSVLPNEIDAVVIPDFPGDLTIMTASSAEAGSVLCQENLRLQSGQLSLNEGTIQVDGTFTLAGGALADANVVAGANGFGMTVTGNSNNALRNVFLNDDLNLDTPNARVRIKNLALTGTVHMAASGASLGFEGDNFWQTGSISFEAPSGTSYLSMHTGGTVVFGPAVTVSGGRGNVGGSFWWNQPMTLLNQGTIRADTANRTLTIAAQSTQNDGSLEATNGSELVVQGLDATVGTTALSGAGSELSLSGNGYDNARTLSAPSGTTLTLAGQWSNSGLIDAASSVVNLCGNYTSAGVGAITNSGAIVNFCGTLDNTAGVLTLDGVGGGQWIVSSGTIFGGAVDLVGGAQLAFSASSTNRIDAVTINGDLSLGVSNARTQWNDVTLNGTVHISGASSNIGFDGDQTLSSGTTISFEGTSGTRYLNSFTPGTLTVGPGAMIVGGRARVGDNFWWPVLGGFDNQGTVRANLNNTPLTVDAATSTNSGTFEAVGGGNLTVTGLTGDLATVVVDGASSDMTIGGSGWTNNLGASLTNGSSLTLNGTWTNAGGITATDSTVNLCGSFATSDFGTIVNTDSTINLCGTLDNSSGTLTLDGGTGSMHFVGGTILNGVVDLLSGSMLIMTANSANRLDGVTINGDLSLGVSNARTQWNAVTLNGTAHMSGAGSNIGFDGNQTLSPGTTISFEGTSSTRYLNSFTPGTLTVGPGATIEGGRARVGDNFWWPALGGFDNQGTVTANLDNTPLLVDATTSTNSGTFEAVGGGNLTVTGLTGNLATVVVDGASSDMTIGGSGWTNNLGASLTNGSSLTLNGTWTNAGGITATDSTLNLCGSIVTSDYGSIVNTSSTVNFCGTFDNTGGTFTIDGTTGVWNLLGGTILNGTLDLTGGAVLSVGASSANRLDGVTINGDLSLGVSNARTQWNDVTLNGTAHMSGAGSNIGFDGNQTLSPGTTISFEGTSGTRYLNSFAPGTLTVGPGATIEGGRARIGDNFWWATLGGFDNQGTVTANLNNTPLLIDATTSTSSGTLEALSGGNLTVTGLTGNLATVVVDGASSDMTIGGSGWTNNLGASLTNGSSLTLNGTWTNAGGITATDSTLNLCGSIVTSDYGAIVNTGSTVNFCGTFDNTGGTFTIDGTTGVWNLLGGTILNGTLDLTGGAVLSVGASSANRLDGVTINGDLSFPVTNARTQWNDVTLNGTAHMSGSSANIGFDGNQTLSPGTTISFEGTSGTRYLNSFAPGTLTVGPGATIEGGRARVGDNFWWPALGSFDNQGTVTANLNNTPLLIDATTSTSSGTFEALSGGNLTVTGLTGNLATVVVDGASSDMTIGGSGWTNNLGASLTNGSSLTLNGTWTNAGGITATDSTLNLCGSIVTSDYGAIVNTGSTVNFCGTFDNTGGTFTIDGTTGVWNLLGGTILNGTLDLTGGAVLSVGANSANRLDGVTINGDLSLGVSNARTQWNAVTLNGTAHMSGASANIGFDGDQTLGSGSTISFEGSSGTRYLNMVNPGTLAVASGATIEGGRGTIATSFWWTAPMTALVNEGTIAPGGTGAAGRITVSTDFAQAPGGQLDMELGGLTAASQYDQLAVTGSCTFDGALNLSTINAFSPALNDTFNVITHSGATGTFSLTGTDLGGGLELDADYAANALTLTVISG